VDRAKGADLCIILAEGEKKLRLKKGSHAVDMAAFFNVILGAGVTCSYASFVVSAFDTYVS
jgi:hypothetical protein